MNCGILRKSSSIKATSAVSEGILCLPLNDSNSSLIWLLVKDDERLAQMLSQIEKLEDIQNIITTEDCKIFSQLAKLQKI